MRWSNLDNYLTKKQKILASIYEEIIDKCTDNFNLISNFDEINQPYTENDQKRWLRMLKNLQKRDLRCFDYIKNAKYQTKADIISLLVLGEFFLSLNEIENVAKDVFRYASNDSIELLNSQVGKKYPFLTDDELFFVSFVPVLNISFEDYLFSLTLSQSQRITRQLFSQIDNKIEVKKLTNALINIHDDKRSGVIHDTSISVANKSYIYPLEDNKKVIFRAIVDKKTTDMCLSLNNQTFFINKENTFKRYFASKGEQEVKVIGLVSGVNLPPINDFTHHCRSYVEYVK